jgi:hypothetical protein
MLRSVSRIRNVCCVRVVSHSLVVQFLNVLNGWYIGVSICITGFLLNGCGVFPPGNREHIYFPRKLRNEAKFRACGAKKLLLALVYNIIYLEQHKLIRILLHYIIFNSVETSLIQKRATSPDRACLPTSGDIFEFSKTDMGKPPKIPLQFSVNY